MDEKVIAVHTSDRIAYKKCRRQWDIISDTRQGRKPIETPQPLDFGQAFHAGFAIFYDPKTWHMTLDDRRPIMVAAAISEAKRTMIGQKARFLMLTGADALEDDKQEEFVKDLDLIEGMFLHYFDYVKRHNMDRFTPVAVELGFEVELDTLPDGTRVVYRGRLDCLVKDEWDEYWVYDWKTASQWGFEASIEYLELDEQMGSYNWAVELMLGIKIAGSMYAQVKKAYPQPLPMLARQRMGCNFSTNKQNPTSYDIALKQLTEAGEPLEPYVDYLNYLKAEGVEYVKRVPVHRNRHELEEMGERIRAETADMLDPYLRVYPSPDPFKCKYCPVRPVCIGMNDGSDIEYLLNTYTVKEERTNA